MSGLNIFATTFNLATRASALDSNEITQWLSHAASSKHNADIVAISVQEMSPLHLSMSGQSLLLVDDLGNRFLEALNSHSTGNDQHSFYLLSADSLCSIGLWVFLRQDSVPRTKLGTPVTARTGFGPGGVGNKGAVGLRIPIDRGSRDASRWETFTFVSAHLAAHDNATHVRNANYETILTSLIFPSTGALDIPYRIFQTSHCVFMGDLNYRLDARISQFEDSRATGNQQKNPGRWDAILEGDLESDAPDYQTLLNQRKQLVSMDTLAAERAKQKTMLGLREGSLYAFAPTYKRRIGHVQGYEPKRRPGYTDRVLFASYDDDPHSNDDDATDPVTIHEATDRTHLLQGKDGQGRQAINRTSSLVYASIAEITLSDHKPVYSIIHFPASRPISSLEPSDGSFNSNRSGSTPFTTPILPFPYRVPSAYGVAGLALYNGVGRASDVIVGYTWCATRAIGMGNEVYGAVVWGVALVVLFMWWCDIAPF